MAKDKVSVFWFRRDLRLQDNCGLYHALNAEHPVLPLFIFDKNILNDLENKADARLTFIHDQLTSISEELKKKGCSLYTKYTTPEQAFRELLTEYDIQTVFTNRDYEPYAKERDISVAEILDDRGVTFESFKDQVIFEQDEVVKDDGDPYLVYTPYSKKWLSKLREDHLKSYTSALRYDNWYQHQQFKVIPLKEMNFERKELDFPSTNLSEETLKNYAQERDYPAKDSTSRLGMHLRFGTVSIRNIANEARGTSDTFLKELIWREFYMMILDHFPEVVDSNFKSKYDDLKWRKAEKDFEKWKNGMTGFPLVDAGIRQLNETGFMHNRVRMLVASFLTKHLLIDWKWGEAYFAEKLLDYELSSNNGNWQWAAGTGVDAQPYFRIFNPTSQIEKFDKQKEYIRKWVPEVDTDDYPEPMVDHKEARERALDAFKSAANN